MEFMSTKIQKDEGKPKKVRNKIVYPTWRINFRLDGELKGFDYKAKDFKAIEEYEARRLIVDYCFGLEMNKKITNIEIQKKFA